MYSFTYVFTISTCTYGITYDIYIWDNVWYIHMGYRMIYTYGITYDIYIWDNVWYGMTYIIQCTLSHNYVYDLYIYICMHMWDDVWSQHVTWDNAALSFMSYVRSIYIYIWICEITYELCLNMYGYVRQCMISPYLRYHSCHMWDIVHIISRIVSDIVNTYVNEYMFSPCLSIYVHIYTYVHICMWDIWPCLSWHMCNNT